MKTQEQPTLITPFVGREIELSQLSNQLERTINNKEVKIIFVCGDYGIGKTALMEQFIAESVKKFPSLLVGKGKCAMEKEDSGLTPFVQILSSMAEDNKRGKLLREDTVNFFMKVAPAWLDLITFGLASPTTTTIEEGSKFIRSHKTKFSQDNVFLQYTNILQELTKDKVTLLFIDDLQWADESSLRLLFHIAKNITNLPLLIVCTYRPVEAMKTGKNATLFSEIYANITRLGMDEIELKQGISVSDYVNQRYPYHIFDPDVIAEIQQKTDGHALFVSQLISWWQESGIISSRTTLDSQTEWFFVQMPSISDIPKSIASVLEERLKRLNEELQSILERASVEGEEFTVQTLAELMKLDELRTVDDLESLENNYQLVEEQGLKEIGKIVFYLYRFSHRFFREYIYGNLSKAKKKILHRQVGDYLEKAVGDQRSITGQLARHFYEAGQIEKAIGYSLLAAEYEQSRYMWNEARYWCSCGLDWLNSLSELESKKQIKFELLKSKADSLYYPSHYEEAEKVYKEALELIEYIDSEPLSIAEIYTSLVDINDELDKYEVAFFWIEQGKIFLQEINVKSGEPILILQDMEGILLARMGQNLRALEVIDDAIKSIDELEHTDSIMRLKSGVYHTKGIILGYLNRYNESISAYKTAIELAEKAGDLQIQCYALSCLTEDYTSTGNFVKAKLAASKAIELSKRIGDINGEAYGYYVRGYANFCANEIQEAIKDYRIAIDLAQKYGFITYDYFADAAIANTSVNFELAIEYATQALNLAGERNWSRAYALRTMGIVESLRANWDLAISYFEQALNLFGKDDDQHYIALTNVSYADTLVKMGKREEANNLFRQAIETFETLQMPHEIEKIKTILN